MPQRRAARMFNVIVLAGVSLAACGGESTSEPSSTPAEGGTGGTDAGKDGADADVVDAGADAPTDARGDEKMPAIR